MRSVRLSAAAAIGAMALSLTLFAGGQPSRADADMQLRTAQLLLKDGRYREAVDAFRRARAAASPDLALAASDGLVTSLLRVGEFAAALVEANAIAGALPGSAQALAIQADALWAMGEFPESERAVADALAIDPALPRGRHALARVLAARSRLSEASGEALAALAGDSSNAESQFTLGAIYQRLGRYDAAVSAFTSYVDLLPNRDKGEKALWTRAQIRFLKSFAGHQPNAMDSETPATIALPFKLVRDKIIVSAKVNGSPQEFVLDTGAEMTILSQAAAYRSGVRPVTWMQSAGVGDVGFRALQVAAIRRLEIGALRMRDVPCLIKNPPLNSLPERETAAFSPIALGLSMTIDYSRRTLTMGKKLPKTGEATELPLWVHRLAMVDGLLNGAHRANFVVDTGGEVVSVSHETASVVVPSPAGRKIPLKVYGTSGWDRNAFLLQNVTLMFAGLRVPDSSVVVLDLKAPSALLGFRLGGIVGHAFLRRYTVTFDLDRSVLSLASSDGEHVTSTASQKDHEAGKVAKSGSQN